tara:strand:+ start:2310 stop:2945 length:636 start_codon:yes stop_codon:yes gene_type:complete
MQRKIQRWLEKLPEETTHIILRAGDDRRTETILERWQPDDVANILDESLELMQDEIQGRLIAYGEKGKQLRSVSIRNDFQDSHPQTDTAILVEGLLRMADEQRRFLATITDTFETMHETVRECMHTEQDTREELSDLQVALAMEQLQNESNEPSTADKALSIFAQVLQSQGKKAAQSAKDMVLNNPEIIDELLNDETIVDMVTSKIMGKSE